MANYLGSFIRSKRGDLSLRELARRCGISHTFIDKLEKGHDPRTRKSIRPTVDSLKKLAAGLEVDVLELLLLAVEEEYPRRTCPRKSGQAASRLFDEDTEIAEIVCKLKKLSPQKRKAIEILADMDESR